MIAVYTRLLLLLFTCIACTAGAQDNFQLSANRPAMSNREIHTLIDSAIARATAQSDTAMPMFRTALAAAIQNHNIPEATEAYSHIVTLYNNRGEYERAYTFAKDVLRIAEARNMKGMLPTIYNSFANRFQRTGQYDSSMAYYYNAIAVIENDTPVNRNSLATLYTNLSGVLQIVGDYPNALLYLDKAEKITRQIKYMHLLALVLINKGNTLNSMDQLDASIRNLDEALAIARKYNFLQWKHLALSNLGATHHAEGHNKEALRFLKEAISLKGDVDPNYQNTNITLLGKVYLALGNYKEAESYLLQSISTAEQKHIARDITEGHRIISELYAATHEYHKAYEHQYRYIQLKDSIESQATKHDISNLEIKYRTAQKDKELIVKELQISRQNAQIKQKNLWIVGVSAGALLLAAIAALLYSMYRSNWHQQRFQEEKFRNLEQEQEIGQLRAMMKGEEKERIRIAQDLHDGIGGMLASIKMNLQAIQDEQPQLQQLAGINKVSGMLADTVTEVRKTAHNLMPDALTKQNLRGALLQYSENNSNSLLQIALQYDVKEAMPKNAELFIYRIIQELVQNIVKHAGANYAVIQLMLHESSLSIIVEDNGGGFDTGRATTGAGLQNIRKKVETLQGYLACSSVIGKGTTIHIEFDFLKLKNL